MTKSKDKIQDSIYGALLARLPQRWQVVRGFAELARYDRPIGAWLLFAPCLWGLALAGRANAAYPEWQMLALFGVGAIAMRGAGCTLNDLIDQELDAKVQRTANRPLPSGRVSRNAAWLFLFAQVFVGAIVLLQFNTFTIILGIASLALIAAYPYAKRITYFPQVLLGVVFNWGVLLGFAATTDTLTPAAALVYAAAIFWTIGYDTIYAHQDKEDDALLGIKSTALFFGAKTKPILWVCYGATLALLAAAALVAHLHILFWVGWGVAAWHFTYQIILLEIDDPASCLRQFRSNRDAGIIIAGALFLGIF